MSKDTSNEFNDNIWDFLKDKCDLTEEDRFITDLQSKNILFGGNRIYKIKYSKIN